MDSLVTAIGELPLGSKAPHVVAAIYGDDKLNEQGKVALAQMFMALYRTYTADGKLWVPPTRRSR